MAKFSKMRKESSFIVSPMPDSGSTIKIQSDTQMGDVDHATGEVTMSAPYL